MTLYKLKKHLKITVIILGFMIYGAFFYLIGRSSFKLPDFLKRPTVQSIKKEVGNNFDRPLPFNDSQSGQVISSYVKICSNTFYGFEVAYHRDWFTTYDNDEQKCTYFAPFSFVIHAETDGSFVPIKIEIVKVEDWLPTAKFYTNPNDFVNIVSDQNVQIEGRAVEKIRSTSTGAGAIPKGYQKIVYLVFDSKIPLVFSYQQQNEKDGVSDFEKILEEVVGSLKYY